ncbi:succinylglutamate desuccinylase [Paraferrimonas haliotis]|uniref:Succinylglutamate desuccinylase n=1 Tax=Paraferrimonas haliotis TaxID=2013866 RepID=A0AA37U0M1_9GAMM|nr:succinylglutamate desuccinylase [Paraferrimonas haliotis]GLS84461.1 succinylglutamate desuccinylase [Paraferrimonas haliotis]
MSLALSNQDFLQWSLTQAKNRDFSPTHYEISKGWQTATETLQVRVLDKGVLEFQNLRTNATHAKAIVLSCGIHGNETAPIEICNDIVNQLLKGELHCAHRLMVQFGNLEAMLIGQRFVEENLNRLFSGAHGIRPDDKSNLSEPLNPERRRAFALEQHTRQFFQQETDTKAHRIHYDLHTAIRDSAHERFAIYPFRHGKPYRKSQLAFLDKCGVDTVLISEQPTTTYSYFSSNEFGADAFTVELGKVKPFGENHHDDFAKARNALIELVSKPQPTINMDAWQHMNLYQINQVIEKQSQSFRLAFDDQTANFTPFAKGQAIAYEDEQALTATQDDERIVFPNANVPVGQRALLTVIPADLSQQLMD